jgi:hypothetical protein
LATNIKTPTTLAVGVFSYVLPPDTASTRGTLRRLVNLETAVEPMELSAKVELAGVC